VFAGASGGGTFKADIGALEDEVAPGTPSAPVQVSSRFVPRCGRRRQPDRDRDSTVRVICKPPSESRFKLGHTTVHCSAIDSGDNTATAKFVVTVKRR
jgi:hypothetical protein